MDREQPSQSCGPLRDWTRQGHALEIRFHQGAMRLEAVAADILRIRFSPTGEFSPARSWDVVEPTADQPLAVSEQDARLYATGARLQVGIDRATGALDFHTADNHTLACDLAGPRWREIALSELRGMASEPDAALPPGNARIGLFLDKTMDDHEAYYGFGQRTGKLNRRHRRLTNWTVDRGSPGHSRGHNNLYQAHPMFLAARPGLAWGLFLHSTWYSEFDVGETEPDILTLFTLGGELDYYLLAGPTPAAVVEQLTRLTGRPALPPLWALGYHQSRWSYASDAEVQWIAAQFRERRIPLDAIHLDIDYMDGFRVFTWDRERFPDPAATLERLHQQGIRGVAIVDPGVKEAPESGYAVYDEGVEQGHFVANPDGSPFTGFVWPGASRFPDFCRATTRRWWGDRHAGLLDAGIDGIWCDMNEPAIVDRPFRTRGVKDKPIPLAAEQGEGSERATHAEVHNLYGSLMAKATAEGLQRLRPNQRPWVLTRSAYTGVQRDAVTWMGDNSSWWEHLEMSLPQVASMGLCGAPHAGVDIGGFYHNAFGELFARWMEVGTFYPFMRCHTRTGSRRQEPWAFGADVEAVARRAIELRYRLLPYLYTLAHQANRSGAPLLRPLVYDYPDQVDLYDIEDQVMLGPNLMLAPVYRPGVRRRLVELPEGEWYDYWTGTRVGPGPLIQSAPPGRPPLFVPAGGILTLGNLRQSTAEPLTELTVEVFPGEPGEWTLIEDDGLSLAYREGEVAETGYRIAQDRGEIQLRIDARRGAWSPGPRQLILQVHLPAPPASLTRDGEVRDDWHWDQARHLVELRWPDDGRAHQLALRLPGG